MKLQACTKCGAQFDISAFQPGQQFSCGACGEVLTAGGTPPAAAPVAPVAPSRGPGASRVPGAGRTPGASRTPGSGREQDAGRAPAASSRRGASPRRGGRSGRSVEGPGKAVRGGPAAAPRGPQYQPVQRAGQGASAPAPAASRGRRGAPSRRRGAAPEEEGEVRGGGRRSAGPNKGLLIGVGLIVVLVVVLLIVVSGNEGGAGESGGTSADVAKAATQPAQPETPKEDAQTVMGQYATERPTTLRDYKGFINRLKAIGDEKAKNGLRTVYEDFIEGPGRDDKEAREFLGYKEFAHEVPEDIAFRDYPYLKAVTTAYNKHWFGPDEQDAYDLAMKAWKETQQHYDRLVHDHRFRAMDQARAQLAHNKDFKDYNYATRWADPYLICYASTDKLSEYDLLSIKDKAERQAKLAELKKKRKEYEKVLDEKAVIFPQLYKEFMRRYKTSMDLKPLMAKYGGRPDYPIGVRSFQDGVPLIVWIFDSRKSFLAWHKSKGELIPHNVAGYFSPITSYIYLYDEPDKGDNRVFEINKNVHEGTHQLEYWFTRQRNKWRQPRRGQSWFAEGIAEFFGAVKMEGDGKLDFLGVNVPRLKNMQMLAERFKRQGQKYRKFPVNKLVGFNSYGRVQQWGVANWGLSPDLVLGMFYQQSWAFVYFLNTYKDGKYLKRFNQFFNLRLFRETGGNKGDAAFKEAFKIRDEDDWEDLNDEFHAFLDDLMKFKLSDYEYTPPPRGTIKPKDEETPTDGK
jgi:hypothetical protein